MFRVISIETPALRDKNDCGLIFFEVIIFHNTIMRFLIPYKYIGLSSVALLIKAGAPQNLNLLYLMSAQYLSHYT